MTVEPTITDNACTKTRQRALFIAGLTVGAAEIIAMFVLCQFNHESRGITGVFQALIFFAFPIGAGLVTACKQPFIGGLLLFLYGLLWLIWIWYNILTAPTSQSIIELIRDGPLLGSLPFSLPSVAAGILLIISARIKT